MVSGKILEFKRFRLTHRTCVYRVRAHHGMASKAKKKGRVKPKAKSRKPAARKPARVARRKVARAKAKSGSSKQKAESKPAVRKAGKRTSVKAAGGKLRRPARAEQSSAAQRDRGNPPPLPTPIVTFTF